MQFKLKSYGYLISIVSVLLLGAAAWKNASESGLTLTFLILGMLTSITGMGMRWAQFILDQREKGKIDLPHSGASRADRRGSKVSA